MHLCERDRIVPYMRQDEACGDYIKALVSKWHCGRVGDKNTQLCHAAAGPLEHCRRTVAPHHKPGFGNLRTHPDDDSSSRADIEQPITFAERNSRPDVPSNSL